MSNSPRSGKVVGRAQGVYDVSRELGHHEIRQSYSEAVEDAEDIGIECMEPHEVGLWAKPLVSEHRGRWGTSRRAAKPLTFDTLCRDMPTDWCLGQAQDGLCIRGVEYWKRTLREKLAAAGCGCDPRVCVACNTGGRPKGVCAHCGSATGWERSPEGQAVMAQLLAQLEHSADPHTETPASHPEPHPKD